MWGEIDEEIKQSEKSRGGNKWGKRVGKVWVGMMGWYL